MGYARGHSFGLNIHKLRKGSYFPMFLEPRRAAEKALMAHYNSVAQTMTRSLWIEPIYEVDPNSDETLWEPWVDGFTRAMRLRPETWENLLD
jgi:yecA family protein